MSNEHSSMLFKKVKVEPRGVFFTHDQYEEALKDAPETLAFVANIASAKDLADEVRKDPLAKWVLFRGQMVDVSVNIPVFVDGRNVETSNEWL